MLPDRRQDLYSSKFGFADDGVTWKSNTLLSTQHRSNIVMLDEKKKPKIITHYNETKSGVDVLDKLVRTYSCKRASSRWTVASFLNMLDITAK